MADDEAHLYDAELDLAMSWLAEQHAGAWSDPAARPVDVVEGYLATPASEDLPPAVRRAMWAVLRDAGRSVPGTAPDRTAAATKARARKAARRRARALSMRSQGMSVRAIADELELTERTIYTYLRDEAST